MSDDTLRGHHSHDVDGPSPDTTAATGECEPPAAPPPADVHTPPADSPPHAAPDRAPWPSPAPPDDERVRSARPNDGTSSEVDPEQYTSARAVIPRVLGLTGARSIVDVGCGSGAWIRACRDLGVPEVVGVDGPHVPPIQRRVATEFVERDLAEPLDLARRFNLVMCVDVAEDLPPERAEGLIADITALAPVVLFAAAVPGQDATPHASEWWPEGWAALFEAEGWTCRDAIRPWIRTNDQVGWRYRQTLFLAVAPGSDAAYQSLPRLDPTPVDTPVDYLRRPAILMPPPPAAPIPDTPPGGPSPNAPAAPDGVPTDEPAAGEAEPAHDGTATEEGAAPDAPAADDGATPDGTTSTAEDTEGSSNWSEDDHPKPPGWDALVRLGRRARRRTRGDSPEP
jgi:SAM-dependent methyltransferase